jgi:hypothetical protein
VNLFVGFGALALLIVLQTRGASAMTGFCAIRETDKCKDQSANGRFVPLS